MTDACQRIDLITKMSIAFVIKSLVVIYFENYEFIFDRIRSYILYSQTSICPHILATING